MYDILRVANWGPVVCESITLSTRPQLLPYIIVIPTIILIIYGKDLNFINLSVCNKDGEQARDIYHIVTTRRKPLKESNKKTKTGIDFCQIIYSSLNYVQITNIA